MKFAKRFWKGKKLGGKWELATSKALSLLSPHLLGVPADLRLESTSAGPSTHWPGMDGDMASGLLADTSAAVHGHTQARGVIIKPCS